jgi:hypothetical protein
MCAKAVFPGDEPEKDVKRMEKLHADVYGLLLNVDTNHPIAQVTAKRWDQLHHLTGDSIVVVAFQPPKTFSQDFRDYWREKLGAREYEKAMKAWKKPVEGRAYDYSGFLEGLRIKETQLPCMVLFTDPHAHEAAIRPIPNWPEDDLYDLLEAIFTDAKECGQLPEAERLEWLKDKLTSPTRRAKDEVGHLTDEAFDYCKAHPAWVALTAISFVIALSTGGILPLTPAIIGILKALKDAVASSPS